MFDLVSACIESNGPLISCKTWDVNFSENIISNLVVNTPEILDDEDYESLLSFTSLGELQFNDNSFYNITTNFFKFLTISYVTKVKSTLIEKMI